MTAVEFVLLFLAFFGLTIVQAFINARFPNSDERLARLERKVDRIMGHLGIPLNVPPETPSEQVRDLILSGHKIQAIKMYREQNPQVGLKEAKDAVEALAAEMRAGAGR